MDVRNNCTETEYNEAILIENKIPYSKIKSNLVDNGLTKTVSDKLSKKTAQTLFSNNIMTYFPSYRFEMPGYLNDPYQVKLSFKKSSGFSGFLNNPIEVITGLPQLANWLMDIVLDLRIGNDDETRKIFSILNAIITLTLSSKNFGEVRFGIGQRGLGGTRIQILEDKENGKRLYPTVFNLSSGEAALLCLFGELIRQADNNLNYISFENIYGIVLIDEIEKHLHIMLQKEIVPALLGLFPHVQFIISSHSPFFNLGLASELENRAKIVDIESGVSIEPTNDQQFEEVYEMMIKENDRFKNLYESIKLKIDDSKLLQLITEGKNTEHILKTIEILDISLLEKIKIISGAEGKTGGQQLKSAYEIMEKTSTNGKYLFVWDCDFYSKVEPILESSSFYKFCFPQNLTNSKTLKGIENLYSDDLFTTEVYDVKEINIDYGGSKREVLFNKQEFLNKIKKETKRETFEKYSPLIEKIKNVLSINE